MDEKPLKKLDYARPLPRPRRTWVLLGASPPVDFAVGLLGGGALSAIVWSLTWKFFPGASLIVLAGLILLKMSLVYLAIYVWERHTLGIGILISLALGGLIMFGTCFMYVVT